MMSAHLWADVVFGSRTALQDFAGFHALAHQVIAEQSSRQGRPYQVYPLGANVGSPDWQDVHQREHINANLALGIPAPGALNDYDFTDEDAFHNFHWSHAQEHLRLHAAAGIS